MTSSEAIQRVRVVAYLVLGAAVVFPIVENVGTLLAAPSAGAPWRFGAIGSMSTIVTASLIGLLLILVTSLIARDRWITIAVGVVSALLALCALVAIVLFVLDAIQVRGRVQPALRNRFDFAAALAMARLLFTTIVSAVLARIALRSRGTRAAAADADVLLVGRPHLESARR